MPRCILMYGAISQIIHILQALGKPCKMLGFKKIPTIHILNIKVFYCLQQRKKTEIPRMS